jgi:SET domain-containing protein
MKAKVLTNCLCIHPPEGGTLGITLDPFTFLMNHSCDPNVVTFSEGSCLRVRSLRPIAASDEITICYADIASDVMLRREDLKSQYFFDCQCKSRQLIGIKI